MVMGMSSFLYSFVGHRILQRSCAIRNAVYRHQTSTIERGCFETHRGRQNHQHSNLLWIWYSNSWFQWFIHRPYPIIIPTKRGDASHRHLLGLKFLLTMIPIWCWRWLKQLEIDDWDHTQIVSGYNWWYEESLKPPVSGSDIPISPRILNHWETHSLLWNITILNR